MVQIKQTELFFRWLQGLKDTAGKVAILRRLERLREGNFGDHKALGGALYELRFRQGAGYRVYYTKRGEEIVILIAGGDKSTQRADIAKARDILKEWHDE